MQNTAVTEKIKNPSKMCFDIKGSQIARKVNFSSEEAKFWRSSLNCGKVLKDMNFLEISKDLSYPLIDMTLDKVVYI